MPLDFDESDCYKTSQKKGRFFFLLATIWASLEQTELYEFKFLSWGIQDWNEIIDQSQMQTDSQLYPTELFENKISVIFRYM